eukprot:s161_g28.t1
MRVAAHSRMGIPTQMQVLGILPSNWTLEGVADYLSKCARICLHQQRASMLEENLSSMAYLKTFSAWTKERMRKVNITVDRCCPVCNKRFVDKDNVGKAFVAYPNETCVKLSVLMQLKSCEEKGVADIANLDLQRSDVTMCRETLYGTRPSEQNLVQRVMAPNTSPIPYNRARKAHSFMEKERMKADCKEYLPDVLHSGGKAVRKEAVAASPKDSEAIKKLFPLTSGIPRVEFEAGDAPSEKDPLKVGVVLSGGQAPGGHNVIAGIFDGIKAWNKDDAEMAIYLPMLL